VFARIPGGDEERWVEVLRLPPSSPNPNAYAERFVLSIRGERLDVSSHWARRTRDGRFMSSYKHYRF
jgi:hypothetical protein